MLTSESGDRLEQFHSSPGLLEVKICQRIQGQPLSFLWKAHTGPSAHPFDVCGALELIGGSLEKINFSAFQYLVYK